AGCGEHLLLRLEKTGLSSPQVAAALAEAFGVAEVAVGYAGMKDKHAVTEQWFSVHTPENQMPPLAGVRLLEATRQQRKLRRGELAGNRFRITLRGVSGSAWIERLTSIGKLGVPNYFGPQRFGGDNLELARRWLPERRRRRIPAFRSGLYLSVLRSFLFNEVLAARVRADAWRRLMDGDVPMLLPQMDASAEGVAAAQQVPTGPLWGRGRPLVSGDALALEQAALEPHRALCEGLEHAGLVQQRRSLVLRPAALTWQRHDDSVTVAFVLPPGGYATVLLAEAFDLRDAARRHAAV
ncbi:MAG: tRNA pseudouridine(13) synthase TruD, partial [Pseudomonadales bacterium]